MSCYVCFYLQEIFFLTHSSLELLMTNIVFIWKEFLKICYCGPAYYNSSHESEKIELFLFGCIQER